MLTPHTPPNRGIIVGRAMMRATPTLTCHGTYDPLVPIERGRRAYDALVALSPQADRRWHDFPMQHEVCPDELSTIRSWLHERLGSP